MRELFVALCIHNAIIKKRHKKATIYFAGSSNNYITLSDIAGKSPSTFGFCSGLPQSK